MNESMIVSPRMSPLKQKSLYKRGFLICCRGGRIRACNPLLPKQDAINYLKLYLLSVLHLKH